MRMFALWKGCTPRPCASCLWVSILLHNRRFFCLVISYSSWQSTLWANNKQHNWIWTRAGPYPWMEKCNRDPSALRKKDGPCIFSLVSWPRPCLSSYGPTLADLRLTRARSANLGTDRPPIHTKSQEPGNPQVIFWFPSVTKMSCQDVVELERKASRCWLLSCSQKVISGLNTGSKFAERCYTRECQGVWAVLSQPILIGAVPASSPTSVATSLDVSPKNLHF